MTLGDRLKVRREQRGWSQNALARQAKVRQSLISELEGGQRHDATGRTLRRLAEALGVTVDYLLGMHLNEDEEQNDQLVAPLT